MMQFWNDYIYPAVHKILSDISAIGPSLLAAFILLVAGWVVARVFDSVVRRLLTRVGFNRLADRAGVAGLLESAGFSVNAAQLVGRLVFWLLMLTFFLSAAEQLKLTAIVVTLQKLVAFLPNVIAVVIMGVLGALFGRFAGGLVRGAAREAHIEFADVLGQFVQGAILVVVVVTAFTQLEIKSDMLEITFGVILGAFGLAVALMMGLGSRDIAHNIIAGLYARRMFRQGQYIDVKEVASGEVVAVETVNTILKTESGRLITLPNVVLLDGVTEFSQQ